MLLRDMPGTLIRKDGTLVVPYIRYRNYREPEVKIAEVRLWGRRIGVWINGKKYIPSQYGYWFWKENLRRYSRKTLKNVDERSITWMLLQSRTNVQRMRREAGLPTADRYNGYRDHWEGRIHTIPSMPFKPGDLLDAYNELINEIPKSVAKDIRARINPRSGRLSIGPQHTIDILRLIYANVDPGKVFDTYDSWIRESYIKPGWTTQVWVRRNMPFLKQLLEHGDRPNRNYHYGGRFGDYKYKDEKKVQRMLTAVAKKAGYNMYIWNCDTILEREIDNERGELGDSEIADIVAQEMIHNATLVAEGIKRNRVWYGGGSVEKQMAHTVLATLREMSGILHRNRELLDGHIKLNKAARRLIQIWSAQPGRGLTYVRDTLTVYMRIRGEDEAPSDRAVRRIFLANLSPDDIVALHNQVEDIRRDIADKVAAKERRTPFKICEEVSWGIGSREDEHMYVLELLKTPQELEHEGRAMHHCVGGYASYCKNGSSIIYSVSKDGQRLGTLEMGRGDRYSGTHREGEAWKRRQLHGPCNGRIQDKDIKIIDELIGRVLNQKKKEKNDE